MPFDEFGNLVPYQKLTYPLEGVETEFVESFAPENATRRRLWTNLGIYNGRLRNLVGSAWEQWLGGSFVTAKQDPGDIDVVSLVKYSEKANQNLQNNSDEMEFLFATQKDQKSRSWEQLQIDGYLIPVYPETHPSYRRFLMEVNYWTKTLGTEENSNRKKGFVSIIHT